MNFLLTLLHLLLLAGLVSLATGIWFYRGGWQRLFALALATWFVGALSVSLSLRNREPLWLAQPHRAFRFERTLHPDLSLAEHHKIVSPPQAERLPTEFDALQHPIRLQFQFELTPNGIPREVTQISSTEKDDPFLRATERAIAAWRFGALPATYPDAKPETVNLTITNRYTALISYPALFLFALIYGLVWFGLVHFTPDGKQTNDLSRLPVFELKRIAILLGFLAGWGWLMVYRLAFSATQIGLAENLTQWLGVGAITYGFGIAVASRISSEHRRSRVNSLVWVFLGVFLLLLTRFSPLGMAYGTNARLWLRLPGPLGFIKFQTIEIVKLIMVFFVASVAYTKSRAGTTETVAGGGAVIRLSHPTERYGGLVGAFILVLCALVLMSDFGPLLLLFLLLISLFHIQGYPKWAMGGLGLLLVLLTLANAVGVPARWHERVSIWSNPWSLTATESRTLADARANADKQAVTRLQKLSEGKEHVSRARWAISSGGVFGTGLGRGKPEDVNEIVSDFLFTALAEELGWIGCATLLSLFGYLITISLWSAQQRDDAQAKLLIAGLGSLFGIQSILIIGGNLGCWPLTGITLPLLSYGGTSLVLTCFSFGLIVGAAARSSSMSPSLLGTSNEVSNRCLKSITPIFLGLLIILSGYQAWLQLPFNSNQMAQMWIMRADGTVASNPRFNPSGDSMPDRIRGNILTGDGAVIAETRSGGRVLNQPQLYAQFTGVITQEGKTGLESYLNEILKGSLPITGRETAVAPAEHGFDVALTLDRRLQQKAYSLLEKSGYTGTIVGIAPQTGEILFAVSRSSTRESPTKVSLWQASNNGKSGLYPFCYRQVYAPGSTFKTLITAATLENIPNADTLQFNCNGEYTSGQERPILDFERQHNPQFPGHGNCDLERALTVSCNSTFAQVGERLGWDALYSFADRAGFHSYIPLIPEELRGQHKQWFETSQSVLTPQGEMPSRLPAGERAAIFLAQTSLGGRNVRMTPMHLALWASAIANDGKLMEPSLVNRIQEHNGKITWKQTPRLWKQVMTSGTAGRLKAMMLQVVEHGTGKRARIQGISIAGKTGSPQEDSGQTNALFIGFAPAANPRLALAIVVEGGKTGGSIAAPIAAEMFRAMNKP